MTLLLMSSILSVKITKQIIYRAFQLLLICILPACDNMQLNNPYAKGNFQQSVLYSSFSERPKHLDPAVSYSANEYSFIGQIYEPPFQYHYLKRPYQLIPLTATNMPAVQYLDANAKPLAPDADIKDIAYTDYIIQIQSGIKYQPHPALAKNAQGDFLYHQLTASQLQAIETLSDFTETGTRELIAEDYLYQIKRLANPKIHSPVAEIMKHYIVGLDDFARQLKEKPVKDFKRIAVTGLETLGRYQYRIRIKGKYPQFKFWLAMPFFAPMPWEADRFYSQQGLKDKNITLDWYPIGTGPYQLTENNPNRRMVMERNPNFHAEFYPRQGEQTDKEQGLLADAGKQLPFIDKVVYTLEKESIPYWNKFLQGYYDASGIASDSFDQAVQFTGAGEVSLTQGMKDKGIQLQTAVASSIFYMGFNMLDDVVGGDSEQARKLRQAISIAIDYEEFISIFMNGRALAAQGLLPPGIYGHVEGEAGINPYVYNWQQGQAQRKKLSDARQLMTEAGYHNGIDPKTGEALILYFDTTSVSIDDRPRLNWYRKQFAKLGIKLVVRGTDYNRFQQKMRTGNAQLFIWGWNADYPDPENFFFLLYSQNGKVEHGGENAVNYENKEFDRLFEQMRNMDNSPERYQIIQKMQKIVRHDAPWIFGFHPKNFALYHGWYKNLKSNLMANNRLKYTRIDDRSRAEKRAEWNKPVFWPLIVIVLILLGLTIPGVIAYRQRMKAAVDKV